MNKLREKSCLQAGDDTLNAMDDRAHMQAMYENTLQTSQIREKEEARIQKYKTCNGDGRDGSEEDKSSGVDCDYCQDFCICSPDKRKQKRKRSSSEDEPSSQRKRPRYLDMPDIQARAHRGFQKLGGGGIFVK